MHETDATFEVDNGVHGHAPELEEIDFLFVQFRHLLAYVGQADERDIILAPIFGELSGFIRPDSQDFSPARRELSVAISQTRQLRAAVRSHETAQEGQHDHFLAAIGRQPYGISVYIFQFKIGGQLTFEDHVCFSLLLSSLPFIIIDQFPDGCPHFIEHLNGQLSG